MCDGIPLGTRVHSIAFKAALESVYDHAHHFRNGFHAFGTRQCFTAIIESFEPGREHYDHDGVVEFTSDMRDAFLVALKTIGVKDPEVEAGMCDPPPHSVRGVGVRMTWWPVDTQPKL